MSRLEALRWRLLRGLGGVGLLRRMDVAITVRRAGRPIRIPVTGGIGLGHQAVTEPHVIPTLRASLALRSGTFVDVGAHLGETLVKMLALGAERRYVGFEPQAAAAEYVRRLLAANRAPGDEVFTAALGDRNGTAELLLAGELEGSASIVPGFRAADFYGDTATVPVLIGDEVLEDAGARPVGVLKLDAEGAELDALRGLERTLSQDGPTVLCEVLPIYDEAVAHGRLRRERADALVELMGNHGYQLLRVEPDGLTTPLERVDTHGDLARCDYAFVPAADLSRFRSLVAASRGAASI